MTPPLSKARKVATRLARITHAYLDGKLDDERLVAVLLRLAADVEGDRVGKSPAKAVEDKVELEAARRVFQHWQKRMVKPKAKLTDGRKRVVLARLKDGYTLKQLKQAIDACSASEFHMGDNDRKTPFNDLTLILRSGEKLEQFLEQATAVDPEVNDPPEIRRLQLEAADAMQRGDTDAYNDANTRISALRATG